MSSWVMTWRPRPPHVQSPLICGDTRGRSEGGRRQGDGTLGSTEIFFARCRKGEEERRDPKGREGRYSSPGGVAGGASVALACRNRESRGSSEVRARRSRRGDRARAPRRFARPRAISKRTSWKRATYLDPDVLLGLPLALHHRTPNRAGAVDDYIGAPRALQRGEHEAETEASSAEVDVELVCGREGRVEVRS